MTRADEVALLRAALRETSGDEVIDAMARSSVLAAVSDDDFLLNVAIAEIGPDQAELDLHIDGASVHSHSVRAEPFGVFVARAAEAVKEITKASLRRAAYRSNLEISAATAGSLRVLLKAPQPDGSEAQIDSITASTADSDSLRRLAILLAQAGQEDRDVMDATIRELPIAARTKVRSAVDQVAKSGWDLAGELRQRHVGVVPIHLSNDDVKALHAQLGEATVEVDPDVVMRGVIDGARRTTGSMWFIPLESSAPFTASVTDADLLERVNVLNATPDHLVRAVFERVRTTREAANSTRVSTSYRLTGIDELDARPVPLIS